MNEIERVRAAYPTLPDQRSPAASVARLQAAYAASAVARVGRQTTPRRRHPPPSRRIGLLAIAAVIVSGTAVAATSSGWRPLLGSSDRPRPLPATSTVPADQLAALAVLRRPQTDVDRGPLVQAALRKLDRRTVNGIHTDAIRVISHGPRQVTVLIPVEHVRISLSGESSTTGARDVLYLMSGSYQDARTGKITTGGKPRTIRFPAGYQWGGSLGTLETLRSTGIQTGTGPVVVDNRPERVTTRFVTLVPDGVARVKVRLRGGRSVTLPVKNNVYRYTTRGVVFANLGTVWFDAAGRRIDHRKRP